MNRASVKDPSTLIGVTVKPNSKKAAVSFTRDAAVVFAREPAQENRANDACRKALAQALGVPVSRVLLLRGKSSRQKVFAIKNFTCSELERRIGRPPDE